MVKRDRLWENICSFANLLEAYRCAARGKRGHPAVVLFEFKLEENLFELQDELRGGLYQPGPYSSFYIHDPKKRLISASPFRFPPSLGLDPAGQPPALRPARRAWKASAGCPRLVSQANIEKPGPL
jgi:hypothetical protein